MDEFRQPLWVVTVMAEPSVEVLNGDDLIGSCCSKPEDAIEQASKESFEHTRQVAGMWR